MSLLLRTGRESRWHKGPAAQFLDKGDIPSDPLGDLATIGQTLSVWRVSDDRSNVQRIVRAIAIGRDKLADMGYVLFEESELSPLGIAVDEKKGATADAEANKWHINLTNLSGRKLVGLVEAILRRGESGTVFRKELLTSVQLGIDNNEIPERFRDKLIS